MAICNVVGSTIAREADGGVYLHAGPEIGVASTKAYTSQCVVMALLALHFGRLHHLSYEVGLRIIDDLVVVAGQVEKLLRNERRMPPHRGEVRRLREFSVSAGCTTFLRC